MEALEDFSIQVCSEIARSLADERTGSEAGEAPGHAGDTIYDCGRPVIDLLRRQVNIICQRRGQWSLLQRRLDDLTAISRTKFYAYPFDDVPRCWMRLFTDASILKAFAWAIQGSSADQSRWPNLQRGAPEDSSALLDLVVATLDMAIIMAGALGEQRRAWIERFLSLLEQAFSPWATEHAPRQKRRKLDVALTNDAFPKVSRFVPPVRFPVDRVVAPSMESFENHLQHPVDPDVGPRPIVIQNSIEHWPARNVRRWNRPSYLLSRTFHGRRLVPIETGRSYVDEGWGQDIIPFRDFLDNYILRDSDDSSGLSELSSSSLPSSDLLDCQLRDQKTGYLAQHDLFTQIPSLRADIGVPEYCYTKASPPHPSSPLASKHAAARKLEDPLLNAWFGPAGTISPLHTDPYHNILTQVVGRKYIRLYAPRESEKLYARGIEDGGIDMGNTSALDIGLIEGWEGTKEAREDATARHALYFDANYVDIVLEEGESLYIPLGWWHYVRSLTVSFSVSFWWN